MSVKTIVTYPKHSPLPGSNPCEDGNDFEHVLSCGHAVVTPTPNEVCGRNCWAEARSLDCSNEYSFWCEACADEMVEDEIVSQNISAHEAEAKRDELREQLLAEHGTYSRKTFAKKRTALPMGNIDVVRPESRIRPSRTINATGVRRRQTANTSATRKPLDTSNQRLSKPLEEDIVARPERRARASRIINGAGVGRHDGPAPAVRHPMGS